MSWRPCRDAAFFLPVQVDGTELSRHDKVVKMVPSPDKWTSSFVSR